MKQLDITAIKQVSGGNAELETLIVIATLTILYITGWYSYRNSVYTVLLYQPPKNHLTDRS